MSAGIISLVNDFSINCVVTGGRVSLAHLIEFAHFVDLYVLEPKIYVESSAQDVNLSEFNVDPDCPIRVLPWDDLSSSVSTVRSETGSLYDAAPVNFTFSFGSYDYWLSLSSQEREQVPRYRNGIDWLNRDSLMIASRNLEDGIRAAVEALAATSYTLMPSSRNLLPFLDVFHQLDTPAQLAYRDLASKHRQLVEDMLALTRPRVVYLPPLLSILLSRCRRSDDLVPRLIELRAEYSDFRGSVSDWFARLDYAHSLKEKLQIHQELEATTRAVAKRFELSKRGFYKEVVGTAIDALEEGEIKKAIAKPLFALVKKGVGDLAPDLIAAKRFTGLVGLMDEAIQIEGYGTLLQRIFGKRLDISQREIAEAKRYREYVMKNYGLSLPVPD